MHEHVSEPGDGVEVAGDEGIPREHHLGKRGATLPHKDNDVYPDQREGNNRRHPRRSVGPIRDKEEHPTTTRSLPVELTPEK